MFDPLNRLQTRVDALFPIASKKGQEIIGKVQNTAAFSSLVSHADIPSGLLEDVLNLKFNGLLHRVILSPYYAIRTLGLLHPVLEKISQPSHPIDFKAKGFSFKRPLYFWRGQTKRRSFFDEPYYLLSEQPEEALIPLEKKGNLTSLPLFGTLKQNDQGLIYLDLSIAYCALLSQFQDEGIVSLPQSPLLPVITPEEAEWRNLDGKVKEIGQIFPFEITGLFKVEPIDWKEMEAVFFLSIQSTALEELREKYRLPRTINASSFQIAFGGKKRKAPFENTKAFLRVNVACLVA